MVLGWPFLTTGVGWHCPLRRSWQFRPSSSRRVRSSPRHHCRGPAPRQSCWHKGEPQPYLPRFLHCEIGESSGGRPTLRAEARCRSASSVLPVSSNRLARSRWAWLSPAARALLSSLSASSKRPSSCLKSPKLRCAFRSPALIPRRYSISASSSRPSSVRS
jgi:hypothetical protein